MHLFKYIFALARWLSARSAAKYIDGRWDGIDAEELQAAHQELYNYGVDAVTNTAFAANYPPLTFYQGRPTWPFVTAKIGPWEILMSAKFSSQSTRSIENV
ncbi:MAG: hypothetical protein LQ348_003251 [Seirophora lacunosa]|nr:MAG: hypothetical protein LQ348_003251 [Seirophora lacunosa]